MGTPCPVCKTQLRKQLEDRGDRIFCDCPCCGPFSLSGSIAAFIDRRLDEIKNGRARLSYALYRMTKQEQWAIITTDIRNSPQRFPLPNYRGNPAMGTSHPYRTHTH